MDALKGIIYYQPTNGTDSWAQTWLNPQDGTYTLTAQAYDYVGHVATSSAVHVSVDNTPPTLALSLGGARLIGSTYYVQTGSDGTTIHVNGSVTDTLVNSYASGIDRVEITIDGSPWRQTGFNLRGSYPQATTWFYDWQLGATALGSYTVNVRAVDRAGNTSYSLGQQLIVDNLPPTHNLTSSLFDNVAEVKAGPALTLYGHANDNGRAPLPPNPVSLAGAEPITVTQKATVWLSPDSPRDYAQGVSAAWLGDVNGDRRADLAVGLPAADGGAGRVTVLDGRGGNFPVTPSREVLANSLTSFVGAPGAGLGRLVSAAGDLNGDSVSDILIGDPANARAFGVFGCTAAIGQNTHLDGPRSGSWVVFTLPAGATLNFVGSAGDVNGDGYSDLLMGDNEGGQNNVYLILGHAIPWSATVGVAQEAAAVLTSNAPLTASGLGTVNGDTKADFAVSTGNQVYLFTGSVGYTAKAHTALNLTVGQANGPSLRSPAAMRRRKQSVWAMSTAMALATSST